MSTITTVPDLDLEAIFDEVATINDLTVALARCGAHHERKLTFTALMNEQSASKTRLAEEFGPAGEKEFARFTTAYPALAQRADVFNVVSSPEYAVAAVRAMRATK